MKFSSERDTLSEAVSTAQRASAGRAGALPVLSGVRLGVTGGQLEILGSDLELTMRVQIPVEGDGDGSAVLPARLLADYVRLLPAGKVTVDVGDEEARISGGRSEVTLRTLAVADFPRLPEVTASGVKVAGGPFGEGLRQVVPAASRDDARPILTGVLVNATPAGLRLVATDSYRLAVRDLQGVSMLDEGQSVLVAAKGLREVQRLAGSTDLEVVLGDRDVVFRVEGVEVTTRLIEGDFPNYEQLIPKEYPNRLTVARDVLTEAVNRVRLVGQGRDTAPIRLKMSTDGLELSAVGQDVGEAHEPIDGKYEGNELTVAFNSQFLLDGLEAAGSAEVAIETIDPLKPATVRAIDNTDFLYLLMPVRIA